ncbi:unnamed protein product (macronuclear) [Paramecium tetraurelia]|uniref:Endo-beta-1,2-glucanase SGL domain-containing protein n=1 Tax=Paramecium tetraurelia TaxID=5888 RepID=A0BX90_PARTE|nr:uncharacterized protein GSPATT00033010001 [Paramecium tetraurelia]CAK63157.1 unnamed protein product [Paramecium tetraurelia]|eukprot:XP_001430555.1 hypothetical protein (macronuclear) [Paramecium tetraurelia strain d4-2]
MKSLIVLSLLIYSIATQENCRFAFEYTQKELQSDPKKVQEFLSKVMKWESKFAKDLGIDKKSGLTLDGQQLDVNTGMPNGKPHQFTASSKESIHLALIGLALANNEYAKQIYSEEEALDLLNRKINTYEQFDKDYPGYGGFLPWVAVNDGVVTPTWDWTDGVPSLDNGQLFWAAYAVVSVLETWYSDQDELIGRYTRFYQKMANNSITIFYEGNGMIRAVTRIQDIKASVEKNQYSNRQSDCTNFKSPCYLDDPYEGELFAWMMYFYAPWKDQTEREKIWVAKKSKLQVVDYKVAGLNKYISVQRGWWFSAHEQWKYLFMPYTHDQIQLNLLINGEKVRTWDARNNGKPGMFASITSNITKNEDQVDYYSACGIEEVSYIPVTYRHLVTPYSTMTMFLANQEVAVSWYHNMISGPAGQNAYGSTEGVVVDGTSVAPFVTWDSKMTTVLGMLGGIFDYTAKKLNVEGNYNLFLKVLNREWQQSFSNLKGADVPFAYPNATFPQVKKDFTTCARKTDVVEQ